MSSSSHLALDFGDLDLDQLLAEGLVEEDLSDGDDPTLAADAELTALTRKISGQYVEVLATWARSAFRGHHQSSWQQVDASLPSLHRLAAATGDAEMEGALAELAELVTLDDGSKRNRQVLVPRLRDWVRRFAALLEGEDARRLLDLVEFDRKAFPLLDGLAGVKGIGPRRLERLYLAGLFTVEALYEADPAEVAEVTGLPRDLASEVVQAAGRFEREWRHQVASDLRRRTDEVRAVLQWIESSGRPDAEVVQAVQATIEELRHALQAAMNRAAEEP